jgi:hypothetical protein
MPKTYISSKKADYLGKVVTDFFESLIWKWFYIE